MKRTKKAAVFTAVITAMAFLYGCTASADQPGNETNDKAAEETIVPVTSIRAQDDFYGYVNLDKLDTLEIGYGQKSAGSFNQAQDIVNEQLKSMITEIGNSNEKFEKGSSEQLIHDYYQLTYNSISEKKASGPVSEKIFTEVFNKIDSVQDISEYMILMAELKTMYDTDILLDLSVSMDRFTPDKYAASVKGLINTGTVSYETLIKEQNSALSYKMYIQSLLKAKGTDGNDAEKRAEDQVYMLIKIASDTDFELLKDPLALPERCSIQEIKDIFSAADISDYLKACFNNNLPDHIYISDKKQLEAINSVLTNENLQLLKDYAAGQFVSKYGTYLPESFRDLRLHYFSQSAADAEKITVENVKYNLPEAVDELYTQRFTDDKAVRKASEMCEDIRSSCMELISSADWLSGETRALLQKKLDNIYFVIGQPYIFEKDEALKGLITDDCMETAVNINSYRTLYNFRKLDKPFSKEISGMTSFMVNACYETNNTITIPLAIMNSPFFSADRTEAENLGGLGSIIAHELSHAFDSNCINFDADGIYSPDWISEKDRLAYEDKMKLAEEYYNDFTIMEVYHVNGKKTLGENFADLGGVQCILNALNTDDEKKAMMESYANIWCTLENDSYALEALREDEHSPAVVRVNAVLSTFDDFYRLYGVTENDGMYVPPEKRVSRW